MKILIRLFFILFVFISFNNCKPKSPFHEYQLGGDFKLKNSDGEIFTLNSLKGKVVLLYFGYTFCPDACPMTFAKIHKVYEHLENESRQIQTIFISVDPNRDTPEQLKKYLKYYQTIQPIGLTGTLDEINIVAKQYGASFLINPDSNKSSKYLVDHSTYTYLIDQEGKIKYLFRHDESIDIMVKIIKLLIK